ncbi:MAG TPA: AAA family ATPase, partial [Bryobacteraceae bacterium]|nr:AAA family ATPase [Bryobacteraceae bacterium]
MSPTLSTSTGRFWPAIPRVLEDIDISEHLLLDIAMRHIYLRGTCSIEMLAGMMKLSIEIAETLFRRLADQKFIEVRRMVGDDYIFALSPAGRAMSIERSATLQYSGPVPVSLAAYTKAAREQTAEVVINRESLRDAFHDIVLNDGVLDSLGPALISQRSLFLYGPSGTGKTTISERLSRVYKDAI